jgi:hypothetical protein
MSDGVILRNDKSWKMQFWTYSAVEFMIVMLILRIIGNFGLVALFEIATALLAVAMIGTYFYLKTNAEQQIVYTNDEGIHVKSGGAESIYRWADVKDITTEVYDTGRYGVKLYRVRISRSDAPIWDQMSASAETLPFVGYSPQHVCRVLNAELDRWKERVDQGAPA